MAGLSLSLICIVGLVSWFALRPDAYVVPVTPSRAVSAQPTMAARTLDRLEQAISGDDTSSAQLLAAPGETDARSLLRAITANGAALQVRDVSFRYVDEIGAVAPDRSWEAAVDASWRFAGFDTAPARAEIAVQFVAGDGPDAPVSIRSFGGTDRRTPLWLTGPVQVQRTARTLVLVSGTARETATYAGLARTAVPVVRKVLPAWKPRLVLEVPSSQAQLDEVLGVDQGSYANIAAVTATVDGAVVSNAPVHVFVNPEVMATLRPAGAQVVISHEATHVATRAPLSPMPTWLLEGFADFVALRDVDLPIGTTAGQIIKQVRRGGPPAALPDAKDFAETADALGAAYEAAWLACRELADQGGQANLVQLYKKVDDGAEVSTALRAGFGLSLTKFTKEWQSRLQSLAA